MLLWQPQFKAENFVRRQSAKEPAKLGRFCYNRR
jgi:hypothetical protein